MVGAAGFEPTASSSRTKRATRLRYAPTSSEMRRRTAARAGIVGVRAGIASRFFENPADFQGVWFELRQSF